MKSLLIPFAFAAGLELALRAQSISCCEKVTEPTQVLAQNAVSRDPAIASAAIAKLRALGPEGLDALLRADATEVARHLETGAPSCVEPNDEGWEQLKAAIDGVSGQCDGYASKLYWYTDFDQAKAAARAAGKPILSLRLLGKLNEDYSCANSRFFRTTLYSNSDVSRYLREHFILHWQSVRPVPKLTIDFGDGRKLERTITGNSVHYVLNQDGEPIDALPGLYGPKAFLRILTEAEHAAIPSPATGREERKGLLRAYHVRCLAAIQLAWQADLGGIGEGDFVVTRAADPATANVGTISTNLPPTARMAGRLAFSKSAVESPVLRLLQPKSSPGPAPTRGEIDDVTWTRLAALHADDARLDGSAKAVVASKNLPLFEASELATSKRLVENPLLTTWRNLERSISEDSVRNEFLLHARIHEWFVQGIAPRDLPSLNSKVYAELFLMPETDPWLGLAPANTFTGLPGEGLVSNVSR